MANTLVVSEELDDNIRDGHVNGIQALGVTK